MTHKLPSQKNSISFGDFDNAWFPFVGAMALISLCLYAKYIFGDHLYIFPLEGSDTYYQYWPLDRLFGEMLQSGDIHNWTYRIGLGKQVSPIISYLNPFRLIVQLMPPDVEAKVYILKVILEVGCAATLMRFYLNKIGISGITSLLFPLFYGFNGYLLLWGQHISFGVIFSLIPLTLYAFEVFLQDQKMWPLVFSLSLFMSISIYFFTMTLVFLIVFMTCKLAIISKDIKTFQSKSFKIVACYLIAGILAAWIILPEILYYLESPRIGTPMQIGVFDTFGWMHYISLLRIFSNNIFGTGVHYYGPLNYYESPQIYCGLLTLLLIPQFFCYAKTKEKIIYGVVFGVLSLALFSPYIAHIFNATFTLNNRYTFVLVFFWIYLAAHALYHIDKTNSFNKLVFYITWSVLFILIASLFIGTFLLQFEWLKLPDKIAADSLRLANLRSPGATSASFNDFFYTAFIPTIVRNSAKILALLSAYGIAFVIYSKRIKKSRWLLVSLVIVELVVLNHPTINDRITLDNDYFNGNKGYYDGSIDAIDYLKSTDNTFYRIHKAYNSVFLNDAAFQGYYGTKGYTSLTEPSSTSFYRKMGIPYHKNLKSPNYMGGFEKRPLLNSLVGVKYLLSRDQKKQSDLAFLKKINGINIYHNQSALPIGFLYHNTIDPNWFAKLKNDQKDRSLFYGALIDRSWIQAKKEMGNDVDILGKLPSIKNIAMGQVEWIENVRILQNSRIRIDQFEQERINGQVEVEKAGLIFFSIPYNKGWQAYVDGEKTMVMPVNNGFIGIPIKAGPHRIRLFFEPYGKNIGTYLSIGMLIILCLIKISKKSWRSAKSENIVQL